MSGAQFLQLLGDKRTWDFDRHPTVRGLIADMVKTANAAASAHEAQQALTQSEGEPITMHLSPAEARQMLALLLTGATAIDYLMEAAPVEVRQRIDRRLREGLRQVKEG